MQTQSALVASLLWYVLLSVYSVCSEEKSHYTDQEDVCRRENCENACETKCADEVFFESLHNDCRPSKKYKYLRKQIDYVKTHDWPAFKDAVKKSNEQVDTDYARMANRLTPKNFSVADNIVPFTTNKLKRDEPTFCDYLATYFTTIVRCKCGRRQLVRRTTFEMKLSRLEFYDPLRMKLSFYPPPLQDYNSYKFHREMFNHLQQTRHIHRHIGIRASVRGDATDLDVCSQRGYTVCQIDDDSAGCFVSGYHEPVCTGDCPHCPNRAKSCTPTNTPVRVRDACSHPSASAVLRRNWREPDSGILMEGPPPHQTDRSTTTYIRATCDGPGEHPETRRISVEGGVLYLPLCCACNCKL